MGQSLYRCPPPVAAATQISTSDIPDVARFGIRQGNDTEGTTPNVTIDGLRISLSWDESLLPVQLASFAALRVSNDVQLTWSTLTEVNNLGFYVERKLEGTTSFTEVPNSFVAGHATTLEPQSYSFTDNTVAAGVWYYRLRQVDLDGKVSYSEPVKVEFTTGVATETPASYSLSQNFPNPFNPSTQIDIALPKDGLVSLVVYDVLGREMAQLAHGPYAAGYHSARWNAGSLASGVYYARLMVSDNLGNLAFTKVTKLLLAK